MNKVTKKNKYGLQLIKGTYNLLTTKMFLCSDDSKAATFINKNHLIILFYPQPTINDKP